MLRILKNNRAQAVFGEYLLVFLIVVGFLTAMTIFVKRALQAKVYDARNYMYNTVADRTGDYYNGTVAIEYEPYYLSYNRAVTRGVDNDSNLLPGATTGIFRKTLDQTTSVQTESETAPPREAQ